MLKLSLINDVDTHWNSTYVMIEHLLSQTAAIQYSRDIH